MPKLSLIAYFKPLINSKILVKIKFFLLDSKGLWMSNFIISGMDNQNRHFNLRQFPLRVIFDKFIKFL